MLHYSDEEIVEAIERLAGDASRRAAASAADGLTLESLVARLREMEAARRNGDSEAASHLAAGLQPELDGYRPTNSTSRSKAVLAEVVVALLHSADPPAAQM